MITFALITGAYFRSPERKTSKAGKQYCLAMIKTRGDYNRSEFWRL